MTGLSDRERRLALNEALFREVNERISEVGEEFGLSPVDIVCECDRMECTARIEIGRERYEQLRAEPHRSPRGLTPPTARGGARARRSSRRPGGS